MENWAFNELNKPKGIHVNAATEVEVEKSNEKPISRIEESVKQSAQAALEKYRGLQMASLKSRNEEGMSDSSLEAIKNKAREIIEK